MPEHGENMVFQFFKDLQQEGHPEEVRDQAERVHQLSLNFVRATHKSDSVPWGLAERLEDEFNELVEICELIPDQSEVDFVWEDEDNLRLHYDLTE